MFSQLLYPILVLAINFCVFVAFEQDQCLSVMDPAMPVPDFWPWVKQELIEENGGENDNKLVSKFVDELAEEDKLMEQGLILYDQNAEKSKKSKWIPKMISFRRSKSMKAKLTDQNGEKQSGRQPSSSSSQNWLRTFSFRRPKSKNLNLAPDFGNSGSVSRSYSMRQNSDKIGQLMNDEQNFEYDRNMQIKLYKESKQLKREIMAGKNDPNCIVAKFEAIKTQIYNLMDMVAAKFGIELQKDYGIEESKKPEKYSKLAMVKQMAKLWVTVGKGGAEMDETTIAKVLGMLRSVMVMAESNLFLANPTGYTRRRRKRLDQTAGIMIGVVIGVVILAVVVILVFFNNKPAKIKGKTCCGWL